MLPQNKFQEVIFTLFMAFVMVYAMICYNIALNVGGMKNYIFLAAFKEMVIMWPIAIVLELLFVGKLAQKIAFRFVTPGKDPMIMMILAIRLKTEADVRMIKGTGFSAKPISHGMGQFCPKKLPIRSGIVRQIVAAASTFIMEFKLLSMIELYTSRVPLTMFA